MNSLFKIAEALVLRLKTWLADQQSKKEKAKALETLRETIPECPICKSKTFYEHQMHEFARVAYHTETEDRIQYLEGLFAERNWLEMKNIWEGKLSTDDLLIIKLLKCTNGKIAALEYISRFDLYDKDHVKSIVVLSTEDSAVVEGLTLKERWYNLPFLLSEHGSCNQGAQNID